MTNRTCTSCETPVPEGALFCPACGEATPTEISKDSAIGEVPEIDSDEVEYRERLQRALVKITNHDTNEPTDGVAPFARFMKHVPGYYLLAFFWGRVPGTRTKVPRTARNLLLCVVGLVPGGALLFKKLIPSGAVNDAFEWLEDELHKLEKERRLGPRTDAKRHGSATRASLVEDAQQGQEDSKHQE